MRTLKIGTRESELAVWQATQVQILLKQQNISAELIFITSEGDTDLVTPLYQIGVQGIFTKTLDLALLNSRIDIAVHSMKDVPTQLPQGIRQAAVLARGSYKDLLVSKDKSSLASHHFPPLGDGGITIATSSLRRKAQWLHRYPNHTIENLRGNINTRLNKLKTSNWDGAIFAAAGLERINLRPENSIELDWMLPAPAQGAIMVVCREDDEYSLNACRVFNHEHTALCTKIERDFLKGLSGGCSTPISALAQVMNNKIIFRGNVCNTNGKQKFDIEKEGLIENSNDLGTCASIEFLKDMSALKIIEEIRDAKN
jgi:hydroxymethylbilane synthase